MKTWLLALVALPFVAGACSNTTASLPPKTLTAVSAGTLQTAWGPLPTYQAENGRAPFRFDRSRIANLAAPAELREGDKVVLDVLVNRDGTIRDVKVQTSSGTTKVDHFTMNRFVGAKSQLLLAANDPAPYVIRYTHQWGVSSGPTSPGELMTDRTSKYSDVTPMGQGTKHPMDR
jgi:hypothetical protein